MRPIALNVFNMVAITDPLTPGGLALAQTMYRFYAETYPVRFGG